MSVWCCQGVTRRCQGVTRRVFLWCCQGVTRSLFRDLRKTQLYSTHMSTCYHVRLSILRGLFSNGYRGLLYSVEGSFGLCVSRALHKKQRVLRKSTIWHAPMNVDRIGVHSSLDSTISHAPMNVDHIGVHSSLHSTQASICVNLSVCCSVCCSRCCSVFCNVRCSAFCTASCSVCWSVCCNVCCSVCYSVCCNVCRSVSCRGCFLESKSIS